MYSCGLLRLLLWMSHASFDFQSRRPSPCGPRRLAKTGGGVVIGASKPRCRSSTRYNPHSLTLSHARARAQHRVDGSPRCCHTPHTPHHHRIDITEGCGCAMMRGEARRPISGRLGRNLAAVCTYATKNVPRHDASLRVQKVFFRGAVFPCPAGRWGSARGHTLFPNAWILRCGIWDGRIPIVESFVPHQSGSVCKHFGRRRGLERQWGLALCCRHSFTPSPPTAAPIHT